MSGRSDRALATMAVLVVGGGGDNMFELDGRDIVWS